ncbi:MAG: pilus assembly protein N-terminal domain-containing protein [Phycisphaerae bacterium]
MKASHLILRLPVVLLSVAPIVVALAIVETVGKSAPAEVSELPEQGESLVVYLRQSKVIEGPWPVKRVSITDPDVADVQILTPRQILLQGKSVGSTDLIMWSEDGDARRVRVDVDVDLRRLKAELAGLFPDSELDFTQIEDVLIVKGRLARAEHAAELHKVLDTSELKYVDMTSVAGVHQVLIKVRVAEASRTALRLLGINAFHTGHDFFGGSTVGPAGGTALNPISIGVAEGTAAARNLPFTFTSDVTVSSGVTLFAGFPTADVQLFLQALTENQYMRVLAEPTLVALSGEEASFLAGGEYPIPIVQGSGGGGGSSISVEYREFGVRLIFRPTVLGDGSIRLFVAPEVSELSTVGAVEIEGFSIPSVATRRVETTLEMKSGQTFAMAGLIHDTVEARRTRVPFLGNLPVLGPMFRSVRYKKGESELVILVTVSLVEPVSRPTLPPGPGVLHVTPDDWEFYAEGLIEGKRPPKVSEVDAAWLKKLGLDRLRGPGAWATYGQGTARSRSIMRPSSGTVAEEEAAGPAPVEPQPDVGKGGE